MVQRDVTHYTPTTTYPPEAHRGLANATLLPVANTHDVLVHGAGHAVVVLGVQLGDDVHWEKRGREQGDWRA